MTWAAETNWLKSPNVPAEYETAEVDIADRVYLPTGNVKMWARMILRTPVQVPGSEKSPAMAAMYEFECSGSRYASRTVIFYADRSFTRVLVTLLYQIH